MLRQPPEVHDLRCPVFKGFDPDMCRCRDEQGYTPRGHQDRHPARAPRPMRAGQRGRMHHLFRQAGVSDRTQRLALTADILERTVTTTAGFSAADADRVLARLGELEAAEQLRTWASAVLGRRAAG